MKCPECGKELRLRYIEELDAFIYFCPDDNTTIVPSPIRPEDFEFKSKKWKISGWKDTIKVKKMTGELEQRMDRMLEKMRKEQEIACPYCRTTQPNDDYQYPVTYWGDDSYYEMECEECNRKFWVKEDVRRTYRVAKTYEELGL